MNASDIMTAPLLERHIGGVPVVESGRVVGLVNEFELLRRHEIGTEGSVPEKSWWAQLFRSRRAAD